MFESDEEKQAARSQLPSLKEHPGWKYIEQALDENIAHLAKQLRLKKGFDNLEQVYALQDRIDDIEAFKNLPDTLLNAAQPDLEESEEEIY